jgi:hypothetical protein
MKSVKKLLACLCVSVACLACMTQLAFATVAGHMQFVNGNVQITNPEGQTHPAHKGDVVNEGDTLTSAPSASAQIKMQDGGFVAMRPDTKLKFDQFIFNGKQDGSEKSFFSLFKGGFRAVTGLIGQINKQNYRITTPVATIGIRGTDHETVLIVPGGPLAQIAPTGAYSKVNVGETTLTTNKGTINVMPNQMGFAGGLDQAPKLQPLNTNIFTVAPAPTQAAKADKNGEKNGGSNQGQSTAKGATSTSSGQATGTATTDTSTSSGQATGTATTDTSTSSGQATGTATTTGSGTASGGTTDNTVRSTAVVDTVAPSASLISSTVATVTATPVVVATVVTPQPTTIPNTTSGTSGSTVNITTGTSTSSTGEVTTVTSTSTGSTGSSGTTTSSTNPPESNSYLSGFIAPVPNGTGFTVGRHVNNPPLTNTNILLDGAGNVVKLTGSSFEEPSGSISIPSANITWSGGTATDYFHSSDGNITFGRWQGGNVNATDTTGVVAPISINLAQTGTMIGPTSSVWAYAVAPANGYVQGLGGTSSYTKIGNTTPFDSLGGMGLLNSASLTANFTAQTVGTMFNLTMTSGPLNTDIFNVTSTAMPINQITSVNTSGFSVTSTSPAPTVTCSNGPCAGGSFGADMRGTFAGSTASDALLGYSVYPTSATAPPSDIISGFVAFNTATAPTSAGGTSTTEIATTPFVNTNITWGIASTALGSGFGDEGSPNNVSPMPNPTSFMATYNNNGGCSGCYDSVSITLSGGTPTSFSDTTTGIQWGYWTGLSSATLTTTSNGVSTPNMVSNPGVISWITAPSSSMMLPMVLTGTANYNLIGGVATDGTHIGTVNSASLSVNFTTQLVNLALNATVNGITWTATGTGATLGNGPGNAGFEFNTTPNQNCTGGCAQGTLALTATGGLYSSSGYLSGGLTGNGLTGAMLSYSMSGTSVSGALNLAGVAALGLSASTPINAAAPYQVVLSSMPMIPTNPYPNSTNPYPVVEDSANGAAFNPATLSLNAAGGGFPQINNNMIDALALGGITGPASATISGSTAVDTGTDSVSGIKWGRWSGGSVIYNALNGSGSYSTSMPAGGLHWILLPASSGPNSLPSSGTYNYVLAGGTRPTDQSGNVGTLNSASLTANFTAMTVNMAASVSMPADNVTFNGSATGVPIQNGMIFQSNKGGNFGTTTCAGSGCGAVTVGNGAGVFTQGGVGAALTYGFQTGSSYGSPTTLVGGVTAFHR